MSDSHDSGAAGRIRAYLDVREQWAEHWGTPENLATPIVTQPRRGTEGPSWLLLAHDDLRAVVAENEAMRKQLAELTPEWEVRVERPGRPRTQGTFNATRIAHGAADAIRQAEPDADISVHSRLVGEWQPAEGGE